MTTPHTSIHPDARTIDTLSLLVSQIRKLSGQQYALLMRIEDGSWAWVIARYDETRRCWEDMAGGYKAPADHLPFARNALASARPSVTVTG